MAKLEPPSQGGRSLGRQPKVFGFFEIEAGTCSCHWLWQQAFWFRRWPLPLLQPLLPLPLPIWPEIYADYFILFFFPPQSLAWLGSCLGRALARNSQPVVEISKADTVAGSGAGGSTRLVACPGSSCIWVMAANARHGLTWVVSFRILDRRASQMKMFLKDKEFSDSGRRKRSLGCELWNYRQDPPSSQLSQAFHLQSNCFRRASSLGKCCSHVPSH